MSAPNPSERIAPTFGERFRLYGAAGAGEFRGAPAPGRGRYERSGAGVLTVRGHRTDDGT